LFILTSRKECAKLRSEITEQKDEDKRAALAQLMTLKEDQFNAAKQAWENKVQELLDQVWLVLACLVSQGVTLSCVTRSNVTMFGVALSSVTLLKMLQCHKVCGD
jgi:hypothetical protein